MALIKALMERLGNDWLQRQDCYNERHKMRQERFWLTENYVFLQSKCKHCGVRKVSRAPLGD